MTSWFAQLSAGEDRAAQELWERYFPLLLQAVRGKLKGMSTQTADEEDVALSAFHTFCAAAKHQRIPSVVNRDELWRTLMLITAGKVVDRRRYLGSQKRAAPTGEDCRTSLSEADAELYEVICQQPNPAIVAQLAEEFDLLLEQLGDTDLRQTALAKLDGYTNEEIGEQLGCSARTIRRRVTLIRRIWQNQ